MLSSTAEHDDDFYANLLRLKNEQKKALERMHELYIQKQQQMKTQTQKPPTKPARPVSSNSQQSSKQLTGSKSVRVVSFTPRNKTDAIDSKTTKTSRITVPEPFSMSIRDGLKSPTARKTKKSVTVDLGEKTSDILRRHSISEGQLAGNKSFLNERLKKKAYYFF